MKLPAGYVPGEGVYKATAYGGFGERLLKKMGWEEGRGLGINEHGLKKAIEVKQKEDQSGVGGKAGFGWENKWWEEVYESKLQKLQAEDSDSDSSGDELTTYTNRDGTQSSATAAELKLAAALSKDPWGRFGGRAGKMARIRAQEAETLAAMQSKLNGSSAPVSSKKRKAVAEDSAVSAAASKPKKRSKSRTDDSSKEVPTGASSSPDATLSVATKKSRKACNGATEGVEAEDRDAAEPQAQKQRARVVHVVAAAEAPSLAQFKATPRSGWWGASRFASAGCLEGLEHTADLVAKQRQTFTEQTQEDLYMSTHAAKTANKKGLGSSSALRKVGGTSWKGQKTVFAEDEHEQSAAAPADTEDAGAYLPESSQCHSAASTLKKAKWKKIARQLLEQANNSSMGLAKLRQKAMKQALRGQKASKQMRAEAGRAFMSRLEGSKKFVVSSGRVCLSA